jgi:membrane protease YdiL (CAAX protease family)
LPNVWLAVATFTGGVVWAAVYQRAPNLFALALSHALMTGVIIATLPPSALHHLRIGFKYFG